MQGIAILFIPFAHKFYQLASISALLDWEPQDILLFICHCTGDNSSSKAESIGVFRL
jgi:hypothetical protein